MGAGGFNSRTLGRVRLFSQFRQLQIEVFQFTHPGKGATWIFPLQGLLIKLVFQFTHPGKGATVCLP